MLPRYAGAVLFGINGGEFIVLLFVAAVVIGPERLPGYAEQLAGFVRSSRKMLAEAKTRVDSEFGTELGDVDWASLDPRRYDPRRIVRDALMEDEGLGLGAIIGSQSLTEPARTSGVRTESGRPAAPAAGGAPLDMPDSALSVEDDTGDGGRDGDDRTDAASRNSTDATVPFDDEAT